MEHRCRVDRRRVQHDFLNRFPSVREVDGAIKRNAARTEALGHHIGLAVGLDDERIRQMPRLFQHRSPVEQPQRRIERQRLDEAMAIAVIIGFGEHIKPSVAPHAERIGEERKRGHILQPNDVVTRKAFFNELRQRRTHSPDPPDVLLDRHVMPA